MMLRNSLRYMAVLITLLFNVYFISSQDPCIYGNNDYITLEPGYLNILISAPHGGLLSPSYMPDNANVPSDGIYTKEVAILVRDELSKYFVDCEKTNARPFLIYNNLHRSKVDPDVEESENLNSDSLQAKSDYHNIIKYYFEENFMLCSQYEQGLLIDIQGHENDNNTFEIGYLVEPQQANYNYYNSSIRQMASVSNFVFDDLVHGFYSLGGILEYQYNINSMPSPKHKSSTGAGYSSGGYIIRSHGSVNCPSHRVNAIQIRVPPAALETISWQITAKIIASAVYDFYKIHGYDKAINELTNRCV